MGFCVPYIVGPDYLYLKPTRTIVKWCQSVSEYNNRLHGILVYKRSLYLGTEWYSP